MDKEPIQESPQDKLKARLVSGEILPSDFLEEVENLDQSTPERDQAPMNLRLLEDADVKKVFDNKEFCFLYQNLLSLTYFHIGQEKALAGDEDSIIYFESSLTAAKETNADFEEYQQDIYYKEATITYLKKDISQLEMIFSKMESGANKNIVGNFILGLKRRGDVNYPEDYNNRAH